MNYAIDGVVCVENGSKNASSIASFRLGEVINLESDKRQLTLVYHYDIQFDVKTYPINLINLGDQHCVVIGGGKVAARKIAGLNAAGAIPVVISPVFAPEIEALAVQGQARLEQRNYQPGDLERAFIVVAATDDPAVNEAIWCEAGQVGCLINIVDDPARSNFIVPAIVRREDLAIAITTGGSSPALARRLREQLEDQFGPEYGTLASILSELRPLLLEHHAPGADRLIAALRLVDSDLINVIRQRGYQAGLRFARTFLLSDTGSC